MKTVLVFLFILTFSCKSQQNVSEQVNRSNGLELIIQDEYYFTDKPETLVIKDDKSLKTLFSKINRTRKPGIPIPKIDFTKEVILVASMGEKAMSELPNLIILNQSEVQIEIGIQFNESSNKKSSTITYPFCVYKMPLSENEVIFSRL